jgi:hypothetical protein
VLWDALAGNPDNAALTTNIKAFLHFFNVAKTGDAPKADVDYTVVRREGDKVYLNLTLTDANAGTLFWKLDAAKYTYNGGNTFDKDDNGIPGEAFYDDYYDTTGLTVKRADTTQDPANYGEGDSDPHFPDSDASITLRDPTQGAAWSAYSLTANISGVDPSEDFSAAIGDHVRLEKYNFSAHAFEQVSLTWTKESGQTYKAAFTAQHQGIYRTRVKNDLVGAKDLHGGKPRVWFAGVSKKSKGWQIIGSEVVAVDSGIEFQQNNSMKFWTSITSYMDTENRHGSLVFTLDAGKTGNKGLNEPTGNSIKLGYFAGTAMQSEVVLIPIKGISLRHSDPLGKTAPGFASGTPDQLVIELADTVDMNALSAKLADMYLFISSDYGYKGDTSPGTKAGVFGDWKNFKWTVDGKYFFAGYKD